jgi:hypothetical protein
VAEEEQELTWEEDDGVGDGVGEGMDGVGMDGVGMDGVGMDGVGMDGIIIQGTVAARVVQIEQRPTMAAIQSQLASQQLDT